MREWRQRRAEGAAVSTLTDQRVVTYREIKDLFDRLSDEEMCRRSEVLAELFTPLDHEGQAESDLIKSLYETGNSINSIAHLVHRDSRTVKSVLGLQPHCTTPDCEGFSRSSTKPGQCQGCYRAAWDQRNKDRISAAAAESVQDVEPEVGKGPVVGEGPVAVALGETVVAHVPIDRS